MTLINGKSMPTYVIRWNNSVIKVGVAYMGVRISSRLKEELA